MSEKFTTQNKAGLWNNDNKQEPWQDDYRSKIYISEPGWHWIGAVEKGGENNPPHPPPGTCTARVQAAIKAGCRKEEEILQWCAARNLNLSRTECRRVMKRLEQEGGVSELVC